MRRTLTLILGVALFGILAAVVVASQGADDPANHDTTAAETVEHTRTVEDNDKRARRDDDARENEDVRGPCDEAEHANDPRCTGVTPRVEDDQRVDDDGVNHDRGDDHGGDRDEVEDHSGPGRGGDDSDEVEDHSGPGHGGDDSGDDDHSGSGHGGRDHEEDD
jgi:hypothetical protein